MYPVIQPGALILIDETKRKIVPGPWLGLEDRPIYFLEHREGFMLGWCSLEDKELIVLPHPISGLHPQVYAHPREIEVVGQIVGVATRLDQAKRRRTRS